MGQAALRFAPPRHPSQIELSIGEKCNLDCDYCFVDKSSPRVASVRSVLKAVDWLYAQPNKRYTVTFTTMEPFLHFDAWRAAVEHVLAEADRRKLTVNIITTTNGLLLGSAAREFIERTDRRLWINISLDGKPATHDKHRPLARLARGAKAARSPFEMAWGNFMAMPKDRVRVICTLTPDQAPRFRENMEFFLESGFRHIDLFPNYLTLWPRRKLERLARDIEDFIREFNGLGDAYDLRLLNRLWGGPYNDKILFGSDEKYYLYEGVLMIPYEQRAPYVVGDARRGVDLDLRQKLFARLLDEASQAAAGQCLSCDYNSLCSLPTPLWLWCRSSGRPFKPYFDNFHAIARTFIDLARLLRPDRRHWTDAQRFARQTAP